MQLCDVRFSSARCIAKNEVCLRRIGCIVGMPYELVRLILLVFCFCCVALSDIVK